MRKSISSMLSDYVMAHRDDEEKIHELAHRIEGFFEDSEHGVEFYDELDEMTNEITEDMIVAVSEVLCQRDGTHVPPKWTKEDAENLAKQYDIKHKLAGYGKEYKPCKFWFAMNYAYATHYNLNRTLNGYVDLAIDELANKNTCFDHIIRDIYNRKIARE